MNLPRGSTSDGPSDLDAPAFTRLTNLLPEAYLLLSGAGVVVAQNSRARRLLGTSMGGVLPERSADPPGHLESFLRRCSGSGFFLPGRLSFPGPNGSVREYRAEAAALRGAEAEGGARIVLRLRDRKAASGRFILLKRKIEELTSEVHERRAVEEELQDQKERLQEKARELEAALEELERQKRIADEANRRKSEFLASMSHELRTPLHGIVGYVNLLEAGVGGSLPPGHVEQIARIRRAAEHLTSVIQTILTFSRLEAGKEEPTRRDADAVRIASDALELVAPAAREKGIRSSLEVPEEPIPLRTDPGKVRQILLNLLSNAVKFTEKGAISVSVRRVERSVLFEIRDTGVGMAAGDLERIFDPFWQADRGLTRQSGGTGLGLTVTMRLARLLGGDVEARSEPGKGSVFTLRLPEGLEGS